VVARAVAPFNPVRFTMQGDAAVLPAATALLLAMAVHELCTNAVKYGALSNAEGRIAIGWEDRSGLLCFRWQESGGPAVQIPTRRGFGTNLIQRAITGEQGSAQFDYAPSGLTGTLEIRHQAPISRAPAG
jgi:two-component sensor histidine kinase